MRKDQTNVLNTQIKYHYYCYIDVIIFFKPEISASRKAKAGLSTKIAPCHALTPILGSEAQPRAVMQYVNIYALRPIPP